MRLGLPVCTALLFLGFAALVEAQTPATDIIVTRQAGFDLQDAVMGNIKAAIAAKADPRRFADSADAIAAWTKQIPTVFPVGSETGHDTKARPEIWSDRAGFEKAAASASGAATKLSQLAKAGDAAGFADQFAVLDRSCSSCHRAYRRRN